MSDLDIAIAYNARKDKVRAVVAEIAPTMQCNCDLDNWQPEMDTGHSWVCRIHKAAKEKLRTMK